MVDKETKMNKIWILFQLVNYLKEFLRDTYPGAKRSPVEMIRMMAMPDIKPDTAIKGIC